MHMLILDVLRNYSKTCHLYQKLLFKTDYPLMQVKSIAESEILSTFIKLPFVFETFVLSIFERPLMTGFTVYLFQMV